MNSINDGKIMTQPARPFSERSPTSINRSPTSVDFSYVLPTFLPTVRNMSYSLLSIHY
ncbi:MAG: hypothetical protein LBL62_11385 [Planctomycetaceae bacterium]|nr:hypothetical protein [Planctomycetaceae bacterium]